MASFCLTMSLLREVEFAQMESDTRFWTQDFLHESVSPGLLSIPLGPFQICCENSRRYLQVNFFHRCQRLRRYTDEQLIAGVNAIKPCHGFSVIDCINLTPLINILSLISPRIFEKNSKRSNRILRGPGETDS
jgi:hypothetical protein